MKTYAGNKEKTSMYLPAGTARKVKYIALLSHGKNQTAIFAEAICGYIAKWEEAHGKIELDKNKNDGRI